MTEHWKFLHAGDFRLGSPPHDVWLPSAEAESVLIEAPYTALSRLAAVAIEQQADAVLYSGNLLDPRTCGAFALSRLYSHFERLAEAEIPVFWALGPLDRCAHWPTMPPWPENVTVYDESQWMRSVLAHHGRTVNLVGRGWSEPDRRSTRTWPAPSDEQTPLVVLASVLPDELPPAIRGSYWALGGVGEERDLRRDHPVVRYAGPLQPQSLFHSPRGGATWLEISARGDVQWESVPLAPVVGLRRRLRASEAMRREGFDSLRAALARDLRQARDELNTDDASIEMGLVEYLLEETPPLMAWRLRDPAVRSRLLSQIALPDQAPRLFPSRLTVASVATPTPLPPEGTLLADVLQLLDDPGHRAEIPLAASKDSPWILEFAQPNADTIASLSREWVLATIDETN